MARLHDRLAPEHIAFIERQLLFFTATAPIEGRINLSPKGLDTLRCLAPDRVAYLDLTGSGNETAAHLAQNARITLMFCSFGPRPQILRIYGEGRVVAPATPAFAELAERFPTLPGARQIMDIAVRGVQVSCGYGVPQFGEPVPRDDLVRWAESKGAEGVARYQRQNNQRSIDGFRIRE